MTRRTVYSGGLEGEAYHINVRMTGEVDLIRTSDVDDGPSRSICISSAALLNVSSALHALAVRRAQP